MSTTEHEREDHPPAVPPEPARPDSGGFVLRAVLAAPVLLGVAAVTIAVGEPFAVSAIASTTAIVLHAPTRYHQRPQRILWCYLAGLVVSAAATLIGAALDVPPLYSAAVAAILIVASPAGRVHPPTVCIALAVTAPLPAAALLGRWLWFSALALGALALLWVLTARPRRRRAG
ncbi:hypothetical protein [Mycolicibacterium sp.]|uniref:hypothetical protein n=1 Tax=Mycolicibacterium sp. TaxID=2320850 RepID=UPI003D151C1F